MPRKQWLLDLTSARLPPERHQRQERWLDPTIFTDDKARVIFKDDNARDVKEVPALFKKNYHPFGFSKPDSVNQIHSDLPPSWTVITEQTRSTLHYKSNSALSIMV